MIKQLLSTIVLGSFNLSVASPAPQTLPGEWKLEWHDEFNGDKLDRSKWNYELGVVRNIGSSQAYTKDAIVVKDGMAIITSRREDTPNCNYKKNKRWTGEIQTQPYSSGSMTTRGIKNFLYGRMEIRARLPKATGAWPAIWLVGASDWGWPTSGEIDIMEHLSQHPGLCYSTFHWGKNGGKRAQSKGWTRQIKYPYEKFHRYAMEWDKERIIVYLNDVEVSNFKIDQARYPNGTNPFHTAQRLIINTAIGGPGTWPEQPKAEDYPARFEIDYVRYYTRSDEDASKDASQPQAPATQLTY